MLCVSCGGKGYYLEIQGFPTIHNKGELVACLDCENGYKYHELKKDHDFREHTKKS